VQKISIVSEEFNGRTLRYEFLQELILQELFVHIKKYEKITIFMIFRMSSWVEALILRSSYVGK